MPAARSRNVALYFACQALQASTTSLLVSMSAIVGAGLVADPRLATLPAALQQLATFAITYPASQLMARVGRRAGFSLGAVLGVLGGAAATLGVVRGSFALFCAGTVLIGGHGGFATFYRFAAVESAAPARRARALGWVMTSGVVAAVLGPWLAGQTRDAWASPFAGSCAAVLGMSLAALLLLQFLAAPPGLPAVATVPVPVRRLVRGSGFAGLATAAMVIGATMVFVMTATPLAMARCHHDFAATTHVIQWHVVAMFAPSFVTSGVIARIGAPRAIVAGLALLGGAAAVNASGASTAAFQAGLILLGLGWNFGHLGVTTALASVAPAERAAAQGLCDLLVFLAVAVASLLAGVAEHAAGWRALNLAVLPLLAVAAGGVAVHARRGAAVSRA